MWWSRMLNITSFYHELNFVIMWFVEEYSDIQQNAGKT